MGKPWPFALWIIASLLLASDVVRADASGEESAAASVAQPPTDSASLTIGAVGARAESAAAKLRAISEDVSEFSIALSTLEAQVFEYRHRVSASWIDTDRLLTGTPRRRSLTALVSAWRSLRTELVGFQQVVDEGALRRERDHHALDQLKQSWSWTLDRARQLGSSDSIMTRSEEMLASIDAARVMVAEQSARLLALQEALGISIGACDDASARIDVASRQAVSRVFASHERPIWRIGAAWAERAASGKGGASVSDDLAARRDSLILYLRVYQRGWVLTLAIGLLLAFTLYRANAARLTSHGVAIAESVMRVVHAPLATTFLLTLFVTRPLRPDPPLIVQRSLALILLPMSLSLLRPLTDSRLISALYLLIPLLFLDFAREILVVAPLAEQSVLLLEMGAVAVLLFSLSARLDPSAAAIARMGTLIRAAGRALFRAGAIAAVAAFAAAALGYLELADLVGGGALGLVVVAILLIGIRVAAGGLFGLALARTPLARLRMVEGQAARAEHAVGRALDVLAVAFWVYTALQSFEALNPVLAALRAVLEARLQVGELDLPVSRVFGFIAVVLVSWLTARIVVFALDEDVYPRMHLPRGVPYAISTLVWYGMLLAGFLLALATLGLDLTRMTVLVSAFGLGLGFGMQQIINNFVSGLILLFERPVQVGDSVQLGDLSGQMVRIGIRSSTIRTGDGADVIIPNAKLIEDRVTNWTLSDRKRRVDLKLSVAAGTEAEKVLALLCEIGLGDPRVLKHPAPESLLTDLGDRGSTFELRVWTEDPHWMRLRSDLGVAIQGAMRKAQLATL